MVIRCGVVGLIGISEGGRTVYMCVRTSTADDGPLLLLLLVVRAQQWKE